MKKTEEKLPTNDEMIERCNELIKLIKAFSIKLDLVGIELSKLTTLKKQQNDN